MTVSLDGPVGPDGMVVDFQQIKALLAPLIQAWDHATLVADDDVDLIKAVTALDSKTFVLPGETTAENLCQYAAHYIETNGKVVLESGSISRVSVRIQETETCYAELELRVAPNASAKKS